jgi:hypothetical protein
MDADLLPPEDLPQTLRAGSDPEHLRRMILDLTARYDELQHAPKPCTPGVSPAPVSGEVCGPADIA